MSEENNVLNPQQPQEVTLWYTPQAPQPKEVVCCYEQPTPLPGKRYHQVATKDVGVWQEAAVKEKRHRRWPWLAALGVLLMIGGIIAASLLHNRADTDLPDDGDSASSIVDILVDKDTTIPRFKGDPSVRLVCRSDHDEALTAQQVYARVMPSVVTVVASTGKYSSIGTGIIMTADGYILTNAHVISGGEEAWIVLNTGEIMEAQLVGYDENEDLAVLKAVDAEDLTPAEFGDSELSLVGDKVYAIGNPLGLELRGTLTDGIISAINRDVTVDGKTMTLIQTNAALNNGNSGGPLINEYGQVIGINTLKMSRNFTTEATVEGLGFALPISTMSYVVNDIIASGEFHGYPTFGFTVISAYTENDIPCVGVVEVMEDSAAEEAGIQSGDILLAADGQTLTCTADLLRVRRDHMIGDDVALTVWRDGETFDVTVTLKSDR